MRLAQAKNISNPAGVSSSPTVAEMCHIWGVIVHWCKICEFLIQSRAIGDDDGDDRQLSNAIGIPRVLHVANI